LITPVASLDPAKMPRIATVNERFRFYNIEMVEVIGRRFWKPYSSSATNHGKPPVPARLEGFTPTGIDPNRYQYRALIDPSSPRLR
jgi:heparanase